MGIIFDGHEDFDIPLIALLHRATNARLIIIVRRSYVVSNHKNPQCTIVIVRCPSRYRSREFLIADAVHCSGLHVLSSIILIKVSRAARALRAPIWPPALAWGFSRIRSRSPTRHAKTRMQVTDSEARPFPYEPSIENIITIARLSSRWDDIRSSSDLASASNCSSLTIDSLTEQLHEYLIAFVFYASYFQYFVRSDTLIEASKHG